MGTLLLMPKGQGTLTLRREVFEALFSPSSCHLESQFSPALQGRTIGLSDKVIFLPPIPHITSIFLIVGNISPEPELI